VNSASIVSANGIIDAGYHKGYDLKAKKGTPVLASSSGVIVLASALKAHGAHDPDQSRPGGDDHLPAFKFNRGDARPKGRHRTEDRDGRVLRLSTGAACALGLICPWGAGGSKTVDGDGILRDGHRRGSPPSFSSQFSDLGFLISSFRKSRRTETRDRKTEN